MSERRHSGVSPVLLSLAVFPGLGQLATGRRVHGLLHAGTTCALVGSILHRVYGETTRLMPADPDALLDPALPFRLAQAVHRANSSFFFWTTAAVFLVWAVSGLDAWAHARRTGRGTTPVGAAGKP